MTDLMHLANNIAQTPCFVCANAVDSARLHVADFKESVAVLSADVEEVAGVPVGVIDWTIIYANNYIHN